MKGTVEWRRGSLGFGGYGDYQDVHLLLVASNDRVDLRELAARAGGGTLKLKGLANRVGERFTLKLEGEAKRFPVIVDDQLVAVVGVRTQAEGGLTPKELNLHAVNIPEARIELPTVAGKDVQNLNRPEDIVLTRRGKPVRRSGAAEKKPKEAGASGTAADASVGRRYVMVLNAPRNLWVRSQDIENLELGLSPGFRVELTDKTELSGEVNVLRGRIDVLGRKFDMQRGSQVRFWGPPKTPNINVTAMHVNDREQVTVFATVLGQGKDFNLRFRSQPPLSDEEIYTLLATGSTSLKRGSGASMSGAQAASSIVGSVAAGMLKRTLAAKLPLDVLSIETGSGEQGLAGAKLEAGTYVTDKIYVGYNYKFGTNKADETQKTGSSHAVRGEYQITPRWSMELELGFSGTVGGDLVWSRDY
jgi:translocation and assembly module TamB